MAPAYFLFHMYSILLSIPIILSAFLLAIPLPIAFPPTVRDATIALIMNCKSTSNPNFCVIFNVIIALIAPLNTPTYVSYYVCTNICYFA